MRLTVQSMERARALASIVLPTPGTSSISRWPSASSTVIEVRTTSDFPSITFSMLSPTRLVTEARVSKLLISGFPLSSCSTRTGKSADRRDPEDCILASRRGTRDALTITMW
jgi:hypothetical protein